MARRGGVQVISRAAVILETIAAQDEGVGFSELARAVDLPNSTVHRIVGALVGEGMLMSGPSGHLQIGSAIRRLADGGFADDSARCRPYLDRLAEQLQETVELVTLDGGEVLTVDQTSPPQRLQASSTIGARAPLHCRAPGKALLADLSTIAVAERLDVPLTAYTPHTIVSRAGFQRELSRVRHTGMATEHDEFVLGLSALSVPLRGLRVPMALCVAVPTVRFLDRQEAVGEALRSACEGIEAEFRGGT